MFPAKVPIELQERPVDRQVEMRQSTTSSATTRRQPLKPRRLKPAMRVRWQINERKTFPGGPTRDQMFATAAARTVSLLPTTARNAFPIGVTGKPFVFPIAAKRGQALLPGVAKTGVSDSNSEANRLIRFETNWKMNLTKITCSMIFGKTTRRPITASIKIRSSGPGPRSAPWGASWALDTVTAAVEATSTTIEGTVYSGEQQVPAEEYAQQAEQIVESAPEVEKPDEMEWLPLGVFALAQENNTDAAPNMFLQLAISKEGIIAGTYNNKTTDETKSVEGMVDPKSGRAAWTIAGKNTPIMETKLDSLTENETNALLHFADGTTQQWLMLHLEKPADEK